jgi:hypothetical protein
MAGAHAKSKITNRTPTLANLSIKMRSCEAEATLKPAIARIRAAFLVVYVQRYT